MSKATVKDKLLADGFRKSHTSANYDSFEKVLAGGAAIVTVSLRGDADKIEDCEEVVLGSRFFAPKEEPEGVSTDAVVPDAGGGAGQRRPIGADSGPVGGAGELPPVGDSSVEELDEGRDGQQAEGTEPPAGGTDSVAGSGDEKQPPQV